MNRFVVVSGCSGGGKSTLSAELEQRGYAVVEEPRRRILNAEMCANGMALPWSDPIASLHRVLAMALDGRAAIESESRSNSWVFFDRWLIDAATGLQYLTGESLLARLGQLHRYHRRVFLTPPWSEIYVQDSERRHCLEEATEEYSRLLEAYPALGYVVSILPKVGVTERADYVLRMLQA
ncbi:ATPase [Burkholderia lata]|uniref:AAA family ATPase n=1 Tax=Burkholderia lata (strain ATCC 17760 / DSM 23089 / LMG 22485 / NCIMB 9086 / R18194 / 383) TaxID=482957 RepID=UPI0014547CF7|nr:AAA family ATPase [Burkholderia lata]VWD64881.1 ATPase [Burkholderia lata]